MVRGQTKALVQFASAKQAAVAQDMLQGVPLHGGQLSLKRSKYDTILMAAPTPDAKDVHNKGAPKERAKDFAACKQHRYTPHTWLATTRSTLCAV